MEERDRVRIYVAALKRFMFTDTKYDKGLVKEVIILLLGTYGRLFFEDIDKLVFDKADQRQRVLRSITQDMYHEGFVIKKKKTKVYFYLTDKGSRYYSKYINNIESSVYEHPDGHNDF